MPWKSSKRSNWLTTRRTGWPTVFGRKISDRARCMAVSLVAGNSWINGHNLFPHGVPYAGCNLSGCGGGVLGPDTLFDYLRTQSIVRNLA